MRHLNTSRAAAFSASIADLPLGTLLKPEDLAHMELAKLDTLRSWRSRRLGPQYVLTGSGPRYVLGDVVAWINSGGINGPLHRRQDVAA